MRVLRRGGHARKLVLLSAVLVPTAVSAQPGFYITPSFSVAEVYDDNVFATADRREADFISRFSPSIEAGYQSARLTLLGRYTFDAEVFAGHPELTTPEARRNASADLRYLPTPLLTLSLTGTYLTTQTPGEFNTETGLQTGRTPAERVSVTPAVAYQLGPLSTATGDYTFAQDEAGGIETEIHSANLGFERRVTPRDTGSLGYAFRHFAFSGDTSTSHTFTLGWTRDITPLTTITLRAGPRFSDGSTDPEVAASIRRTFKHGELSVAYARTQATVVGERGVVESESFGVTLIYRLLAALEVRVAPVFITSTRGDLEATVYGVGVEAVYRVAKGLFLTGSYRFSLQQGNLVPGARRDEEIQRNVVTLSLVVTYPYRLR